MYADLDGSVVDEEAIQGVESLASTIQLAEGNGSNTTADTIRAVGKLHTLDRSNGGREVLLGRARMLVYEIHSTDA